MGAKHSKKGDHHSTYENVLRAYAKWDHRSGLVSQDVSRVAINEMRNLEQHKQAAASSSQNPIDQQRQISPSSGNYNKKQTTYDQRIQYQFSPSIQKHHYEKNIQGNKLAPKRSQSMDTLPTSNHRITDQSLSKSQTKRQQIRNKSPSSQSFLEIVQHPDMQKSDQNISSNNKTNKVTDNLQLILIDQDDLKNVHEIGKGNFGTVYRALYKGTRDVALKTLNCERNDSPNGIKSSSEQYHDLLYEANIMKHLQHQNLLCIIGVTFFGENYDLSLVTDLMKNGCLLDYLRKNRKIFTESNARDVTLKLNSFSRQIFEAMLYLEQRRIIHRDLAARNCLIDDGDILKVGDFGLTKLTDCGLYKGTYRTICAPRWTSPEAIFSSKYSSRSDVWSYGITLWEIYSLGDRPYGDMSNTAVRSILKNASENLNRYLPQSSQFGSDEVYTHIILSCLTYNLTMRPRFRDLIERVRNICTEKIQ